MTRRNVEKVVLVWFEMTTLLRLQYFHWHGHNNNNVVKAIGEDHGCGYEIAKYTFVCIKIHIVSI